MHLIWLASLGPLVPLPADEGLDAEGPLQRPDDRVQVPVVLLKACCLEGFV